MTLTAAEPEERLGLDPLLRGVWKLHASSTNKGKTVEESKPPFDVAVARATSIKFAGGDKLQIEKVMIVNDDDGDPGNFVILSNGNMLFFSKKKGSPFFMIQVFKNIGEGKVDETNRYIITVE
jgi:hypothetical protein